LSKRKGGRDSEEGGGIKGKRKITEGTQQEIKETKAQNTTKGRRRKRAGSEKFKGGPRQTSWFS